MKKVSLTMVVAGCTALLPAVDIYLAGDSTCANYKEKDAPMTGWGQVLPNYCKTEVKVVNLACCGKSTKSFTDEGRWARLLEAARPGDYVIVQFGHNDGNTKKLDRYTEPETTYKDNLRSFVKDAKAKQLKLVFATSITTHSFEAGKKVKYMNLDAYVKAMKEVAAETNTPLVDLFPVLNDEVIKLGEEKSKAYYMYVKASDFPNLKEDRDDGVHLRKEGADWVARTFVRLAKEQKLEISDCFK